MGRGRWRAWMLAAIVPGLLQWAGPAAHAKASSVAAERLARQEFGVPVLGPAPVPRLRLSPRTISVRAVRIRAEYGVTFKLPVIPPKMHLPWTPARGFQAYTLVLAPHQLLTVAQRRAHPAPGAGVGTDGSYGFTLVGRAQRLSVMSSGGGCAGCELGAAIFWFPKLAPRLEKEWGFPTTLPTIQRLSDLVAYRYLAPRLVVYAFRTTRGRVRVGFVAAPLSPRPPLGVGGGWGLDVRGIVDGTGGRRT